MRVKWLLWLVALGLSVWVCAKLPVASIVHTMSALSLAQWFIWAAINMVVISLGVYRWQCFIQMLKARITFSELFVVRQAGQLVNCFTPGPQVGGEPLQIFWLVQRGLSLQKSLLSLAFDRAYEVCINMSILGICLFVLLLMPNTPLSGNYRPATGSLMLLVALSGLALIAYLWSSYHRRGADKPRHPWWNKYLRLAEYSWFRKCNEVWQLIKVELIQVRATQKLALLRGFLISIAAWGALVGELLLVLDFVAVDIGLSGFLVILIAMRLALLMPIPGGIGTLEAAIFWSFQSLQLSIVAAVGFIALIRLRDAVLWLLGLLCLKLVYDQPVKDSNPGSLNTH